MNDRNITNARFIQVNQLPQIDSHLTAKLYVDNSIDEISLVRNNQDNDFNNNNLTNINSITLNQQAENDNEVITKAYVDQFHQENERSRQDLGIDFYNASTDLVKNTQDNDLNDNKLINLDCITVNRNPSSDNEVANKKVIDDELDKNTVLRFSQTLQNYLKVSIGNNVYNLTKYDKIQLVDITEIKYPNKGYTLLPRCRIKNNNKVNGSKIGNFMKSTKTSSPRATNLSPIGNAFMYIETSSNNNRENVILSFERTDIVQSSNITFYYNIFSSSDTNSRAMVGLEFNFVLDDNTWSTQLTISKINILIHQLIGLC